MQRVGLLIARLAAGAVGAVLLPSAAASQSVVYSPDVDAQIGALSIADEGAFSDDGAGTVFALPICGLPRGVAVDGYHLDGGDVLFSLDTVAEVGGVSARPADVLRTTLGSGTFSLEFDAAGAGVPDGANVDAVSTSPSGDLVLSFDRSVVVGAVLADDEDLVEFDGASFSQLLDGSAEGVWDSADLDAAHVRSDGTLLVSFDVNGRVGGLEFDDDDVLDVDLTISAWSTFYDGSSLHASLEAGDVETVALPEPGGWLPLASGLALLAALARRRTRHGPHLPRIAGA